MNIGDEQYAGDGAAESNRSVSGDVREREDPETDEDAEREQREDEPDRERANQQEHVRFPSLRPRDPARAADELAFAGARRAAIVAQQVHDAKQLIRLEQPRRRFP